MGLEVLDPVGVNQVMYHHRDHLGSIVAHSDAFGAITRMSFDPWGARRDSTSIGTRWDQWGTLSLPTYLNSVLDVTPRGFTGHEHLDGFGLIHMNGRIYDPIMARFLQADPFMEDTGTLNRYTYVHNNPMVYTDPSGYTSLRQIASYTVAAVAIMFPPTSWAAAAAYGAAQGAITDGSIKGTVLGAFQAVAFYQVGKYFDGVGAANVREIERAAAAGEVGSVAASDLVLGTKLTAAQVTRQTLAHAATAGVFAHLNGGKFGHAFASAGVAKLATPFAGYYVPDTIGQAIAVSVIGGTTSEITGGKFANGATTAAMAFALNQVASGGSDSESSESQWSEEEIRVAVEDAQSEYWERIRRLSPGEFMEEFPDWHRHPVLDLDSDPRLVLEVGLATLRDQGGLAAGRIANLRRYTASQLAEVYGTGTTGAPLGKMPKTQAAWNIYTHPRPPSWQFWRSARPEVTIGCSVGRATCFHTVQ